MARSRSIWLLIDSDNAPVAAFTVKHELLEWLQHNRKLAMNNWRIFKFQDGLHQLPYAYEHNESVNNQQGISDAT